jgi:DNA-binding transcriptional regulator GbsR (MarR family)
MPELNPPSRWGTRTGLNELFGDNILSLTFEKKIVHQYYHSLDHAVEVFSKWFGPTLRALEASNKNQQKKLLEELKEVFNRYNRSEGNTPIIENTYAESIITVKAS